MKRFQSFGGIVLALLILIPLWGCGGGGGNRVEGRVTFDGEPVEKGEIQFISVDADGGIAAGPIVNGAYSIEASPGEKKVRVSATREADQPAPDGLANYIHYIPAKYNEQTELTRTVEPGRKNEFNFDLEP